MDKSFGKVNRLGSKFTSVLRIMFALSGLPLPSVRMAGKFWETVKASSSWLADNTDVKGQGQSHLNDERWRVVFFLKASDTWDTRWFRFSAVVQTEGWVGPESRSANWKKNGGGMATESGEITWEQDRLQSGWKKVALVKFSLFCSDRTFNTSS